MKLYISQAVRVASSDVAMSNSFDGLGIIANAWTLGFFTPPASSFPALQAGLQGINGQTSGSINGPGPGGGPFKLFNAETGEFLDFKLESGRFSYEWGAYSDDGAYMNINYPLARYASGAFPGEPIDAAINGQSHPFVTLPRPIMAAVSSIPPDIDVFTSYINPDITTIEPNGTQNNFQTLNYAAGGCYTDRIVGSFSRPFERSLQTVSTGFSSCEIPRVTTYIKPADDVELLSVLSSFYFEIEVDIERNVNGSWPQVWVITQKTIDSVGSPNAFLTATVGTTGVTPPVSWINQTYYNGQAADVVGTNAISTNPDLIINPVRMLAGQTLNGKSLDSLLTVSANPFNPGVGNGFFAG
jgi:hypothetical protein